MLASGAAANAAAVYASDVYVDAGANQKVGDSQRFGSGNALGAADGDFYSLGFGDGALFTFGGDVMGPGTIFKVTFNCAQTDGACSHYPETAEIFGVSSPFGLDKDGTVGGVTNYDLTSLDKTFLAAVPNGSAQGGFEFDTGEMTFGGIFVQDTSTNNGDGFDIASISATPAAIPLPSAAVLLVGALGGLGAVHRRRG